MPTGSRCRGFALLFILLAASSASAAPRGAPPVRDPCSGLRDSLPFYFARAGGVWNPDPWAYADDDLHDLHWSRRAAPRWKDVRFVPPSAKRPGPSDAGCTQVDSRFLVDADTISFTVARVPEQCSEAPVMIWKTRDGRRFRRAIHPLFNWNVDALWCTRHYLVMGLNAAYEVLPDEAAVGSPDYEERVAIWNLRTGDVVLSPGYAWDAVRKRTRRPDVYVREDFPSWREASVAEMNGAVILANGDTTMTFWPEKRAYAFRKGR